ncbi:pentatricopeptide repeat-containing protein At4g02750-like [Selaginella moellendorffii]|uniref:pentatricopeptide repeat-containing protein At4g02750-like n=1 Tax=Selaginella moellendorffii TaxID=88036 RepID=UPI000D1CB9C6|nr:pentatricopeptide repeat-containing protein At4g02750-like [Selaginella moellendorffii]|eukprot:XP_024522039.1 pentatricopeptide repeat-containing protein At4g02750-like [Selaginella moellendorffii]
MGGRDVVCWNWMITVNAQNRFGKVHPWLPLWLGLATYCAKNGQFDQIAVHDEVCWNVMLWHIPLKGIWIAANWAVNGSRPTWPEVHASRRLESSLNAGNVQTPLRPRRRSRPFVRHVRENERPGCRGNWHLELAKELFDSMPLRTTATWNTMIGSFLGQEAYSLILSMPAGDTMSWILAVTVLAQMGHINETDDFFVRMPEWEVYVHDRRHGPNWPRPGGVDAALY